MLEIKEVNLICDRCGAKAKPIFYPYDLAMFDGTLKLEFPKGWAYSVDCKALICPKCREVYAKQFSDFVKSAIERVREVEDV